MTATEITIPEIEALSVDLGPDQYIDLGTPVILTGIPNFNVDSLIWSPMDSLSNPASLTTLAQPVLSTTYTLMVFDENGCPAVDDILIIVNRDVPVFIPNVFSPNSDGINDVFTVFGGEGVSMINALKIFDRWGNAVFESGPFRPMINIRMERKVQRTTDEPGCFVYYVEVEFVDGRRKILKGRLRW